MQKFHELKYVRPDQEAVEKAFDGFIDEINNATSGEELCAICERMDEYSREFGTMYTIASIRNTMDMRDQFYEDEMMYLAEAGAKLQLYDKKVNTALLASPYLYAVKQRFGDLYVTNKQMQIELMNDDVVPLLVREDNLGNEYSKTAALAHTDFRGEDCNFYGLLKHMNAPDRNERREAFVAWADLYQSIAHTLDKIYDELVALRVQIAQKLGFESYIDYIYKQRGRYDYNAQDVAAFRKQVREEIVPVCQKLYDEQTKRLGIDKLHWYDEALAFADGNADPIGDKDELVAKAMEFYSALSDETGEFFAFMVNNELFDLETRPGKHMGGYCTFLPLYRAPFIFSNFNGTSADVDVLTHEAGHAFQAYTASRTLPLDEMVWSTNEVNEIHSMSMEHFAYPYAEEFFGEAANKYRYNHLKDALCSIPYLVSVDEFQHRVFERPQMTAAERRQVWREIEQTYMPWRDYDGNEFLSSGGFWMQKQHIFLYPFYYVDYALAQICAFQFLAKDRKDHAQAWKDYLVLCRLGGSKGYFDTLRQGKLLNPFASDTVAKVMVDVNAALAEFAAKI